MPGVRRVMADNPGPFTFKGTLSYIIGRGKVAIVDPGPDDPRHIAALLDAVRNETVTHIFVTHTHRDHSPAVPAIKAATGATVYAEGPHRAARPLAYRRAQSARGQRRPRFPARRHAQGRRGGERRRLEHRSGGDARPHRQPHGLRVQGQERAVCRRSRDGLGHLDRGAARWRDERLHGLAAQTREAEGANLFPRPWPGDQRRVAVRELLHPASHGARGFDPASAVERRDRYSDHRARDLYRHRSALDGRRRPLGAGASGRPGDARRGRDRRPPAVERLSLGSTA